MLQFAVGVAAGLAFARGWRPRVSLPYAVLGLAGYSGLLLLWRQAVPESSP